MARPEPVGKGMPRRKIEAVTFKHVPYLVSPGGARYQDGLAG